MTILNNDYKFLIIGSGLAGLYSAMCASKFGKVAVLTKSSIEESSSYWAQGGIAAVMDRDDSIENHYSDTINAGQGLCNETAVKVLVIEGKERIQELINLGMKFDSSDNQLLLGLEGGHSKRRILHAGGSETGKKIIEFVIGQIKENKNIHVYENSYVYEIISDGKYCKGAKAFNWKENKTYTFIAPATILASGGLSGIFSRSTNPHVTTGDGIALAYFAGADLADLEFIQFHPTAFYSETGETFLVSEAVRGEGAFLLNENQERFMTAIDKRAELAPRDIVAKAIYEVIKNQDKKYIYLDAKNIPPDYFSTRFPNIFKDAKRFGFNLPEELLPVAPAAHYTIGGVKTDINSRTNVSGLYSCGETAANGIHGANRLASNSLLECLVFGKRAVDSAVNDKYDFKIAEDYVNVFKTCKEKEEDFLKIRNTTANLLNENAGILRDGKSLKKGLEIINELKRSFIFIENEYYSTRAKFLLTLAELILLFANNREETRGCHSRKDFPENKNKFEGNFIAQLNNEIIFKSFE